MLILDTDHLTLLERGGADALALQMHLEIISPDEVATTIITYEEQMRGWLAHVAQATSTEKMLAAYARLQTHIRTFQDALVLPFEQSDANEFARLQKAHIRVGTMDL